MKNAYEKVKWKSEVVQTSEKLYKQVNPLHKTKESTKKENQVNRIRIQKIYVFQQRQYNDKVSNWL